MRKFLRLGFIIKVMAMLIAVIESVCFSAFGQTRIAYADQFKIHSAILKEEREYLLRLPASYHEDDLYHNKRYPVLVLLDADTHFFPVGGLVHSLSVNDEIIPEMIVVGIRNTDRTRDMTSSASGGAFIQFIENELLKEIDQRYRTLPFRILAGHSLAGLFTLDCFLSERSFQGYISIDPTVSWANGAIIEKADAAMKQKDRTKSFLYLSEANNPFDTSALSKKRIAYETLVSVVNKHRYKSLTFKNEYFKNEDHFSIPSVAYHTALLFLFDGFKIPLYRSEFKRTSDITAYYENFQQHLGAPIQPPGKLIDQVAMFWLNEKKIDEAIELLKFNEMYYPHSFVTHRSLGRAYDKKKNIALAIKHYKTALGIRPQDAEIKKILDKIQQ